ncbi:MAG: hypothetical protein HKN87_14200 [Saprospiraceae bacterium]|nr:hypothetical protein [Saprospiraceae bacterium]
MNGRSKLRIFFFDHLYLLSLLLFFILAVILVNPIGNFPLNDDFQYAYAVDQLWETGVFSLGHRISPNIFLQVSWGYLWTLLTGSVDYTTLRCSTLFAACISLFYTFRTLQLLSGNEVQSFLLTLVFGFTPVFFLSAFSFMTEIPFIAAVSASLYYYLSFIHSGIQRDRLFGFLTAIAALLIRQPGILIILCFEGWFIWTMKDVRKWMGLGYLVAAIVVYAAVELFIKSSPNLASYYESVGYEYLRTFGQRPIDFLYLQLKYGGYLLIMCGFYFLPILPPLLHDLRNQISHFKRWIALAITISVCISILLPHLGHTFPYNGSIFRNFSLGVPLLADYYWGDQVLPSLPNVLLYQFAFMSIFSAIIIGMVIWQRRNQSEVQLLLLTATAYQIIMSIFSYTDRYILWPLLFLGLIIAKMNISLRRSWPLSLPALCLLIFISIAGTRDYLTWNRIIMHKYQEMIAEGMPTAKIDAGTPINAHFGQLDPGPVKAATRIFAFTKNPDLVVVDSLPFFRYLSMEFDQIYILGMEHRDIPNE